MERCKADLDAAIEVWIEAYGGHKRFLEATEALYLIFAGHWQGPRRSQLEAFDAFRESLINECAPRTSKTLEPTRVATDPVVKQ